MLDKDITTTDENKEARAKACFYPDNSLYVSGKLKKLSLAMTEFYEAVLIASRYDGLCDILDAIQSELKVCMEDNTFTCEEKEFVSYAEDEFSSFLPYEKSDRYIPEIIKWCLSHNLLQQAVTMSAEWTPRYLIFTGIVTDNDGSVEKECDRARHPWDTWGGYLFKTYNPYVDILAAEKKDEIGELNVKSFRSFVKNSDFDYYKIMKGLNGRNIKIDTFLRHLMQLDIENHGWRFPYAVTKLPETDSIKIVCRSFFCMAGEAGFEKSLVNNYKGTMPTTFILKMFGTLKSDVIAKLFDIPLDSKIRTAKSDDDVESKIRMRQRVFARLIEEKRIGVVDTAVFLQMAELHGRIVEFYRNRMNHGVIEFKGIDGNMEIVADVRKMLSMAEKLVNK